MSTNNVARLEITLDWVEPRVMRRLEVPLDLRLDRMHLTIQAAMGWMDCHLWGFRTAAATYGPPQLVEGAGDDYKRADKATVRDLIEGAGRDGMVYTYDFGDDWEHVIVVEAVGEAEAGELYPRVLAAEGACPPEDVGGPPGYEALLEALADPKHEDHKELLSIFGGPLDPTDVDMEATEAQVRRLANRWKPRPRRVKTAP